MSLHWYDGVIAPVSVTGSCACACLYTSFVPGQPPLGFKRDTYVCAHVFAELNPSSAAKLITLIPKKLRPKTCTQSPKRPKGVKLCSFFFFFFQNNYKVKACTRTSYMFFFRSCFDTSCLLSCFVGFFLLLLLLLLL